MPSGKPIDWSIYDEIIRSELSKMTIKEWRDRYASHLSDKTVGSRARKLGVLPNKYKPTENHKKSISNKLLKETPEMVEYVKSEIDNKSRREIAKIIGLSEARLGELIVRHSIKLSEKGKLRAKESTRSSNIGRAPWNKGKQLSDQHKINMAIGRQKMSGRLSKLQAAFYTILDNHNINYVKEDNQECRFGPWTFDCRIKHNDKDILVEVQGDYIHSLPKNVIKDRAKATYMERYHPNIEVKYIWEHEFGAANRVKQKVYQWLGLDRIEQIDFAFADITVKEIDENEASMFLSSFHYLGKLSGRYKFGAYLQNSLVAVAIFSAPTRIETALRLNKKPNECLELRRFVIHDAYHKKNFGSFLLAKFEKQIPKHISTLVSFADAGVGHLGTIYKAANWTLDGECQQSYYYIDESGYVMLKKTLYNLANKMHMKEKDYAITYGYEKVMTPKKFRYVKKINVLENR